MTDTFRRYRSNGYHYQQFSCFDPLQLASWQEVVDTTAAAIARMGNIQSGDVIFDSTQQIALEASFNVGLNARIWRGSNCTVALYVAGTGGITRFRTVQLDAANPGDVIPPGAGEPYHGVALNTALENAFVYVLTEGMALIELSTPLVAIAPGAKLKADVDGKVLLADGGSSYSAWTDVPLVTISGVSYCRAQMRIPVDLPVIVP